MWSLFRCSHKKTTIPMKVRGELSDSSEGNYVACLDCGQELPYSLEEMKIIKLKQKRTEAS
jgi:hypothetical protein